MGKSDFRDVHQHAFPSSRAGSWRRLLFRHVRERPARVEHGQHDRQPSLGQQPHFPQARRRHGHLQVGGAMRILLKHISELSENISVKSGKTYQLKW